MNRRHYSFGLVVMNAFGCAFAMSDGLVYLGVLLCAVSITFLYMEIEREAEIGECIALILYKALAAEVGEQRAATILKDACK